MKMLKNQIIQINLITNRISIRSKHTSNVLVNPEWIKHTKEKIKILDCESFEAVKRAHIPSAIHLPLAQSAFKNPGDPQRLYLLQKNQFEQLMTSIGADRETTLLFYDDAFNLKSTRAWWVSRYFGHPRDKIKILNGGWSSWSKEENAISFGDPHVNLLDKPYKVQDIENQRIEKLKDIISRTKSNKDNDHIYQIIDARSKDEYFGEEHHTNNKKRGHIPGALNLEWKELINTNNYGTFKEKHEIEKIVFDKLKLKSEIPSLTYCQIGVRASLVAFVLEEILNFSSVKVYDGSMAEYANSYETNVVKENE